VISNVSQYIFGHVCVLILKAVHLNTLFICYYSIGVNVKLLIDRPDGTYCFREKKDRVYYISEKLLHLAHTVKPDHLISAGTCFGKFTKTNKFRLHITALTYIAPYAPFKIWVKPSAEQQFLYGHHVIKSGKGFILLYYCNKSYKKQVTYKSMS
jgi:hypothetical protein